MFVDPTVDIIMATYNGEMYIAQQLDSIINQTYKNWRLLIRDDGSNDKTVDILTKYALRYSDTIVLLPPSQHLGPKDNFAGLLTYSKASYTMFSDQDDVWLPTKVADTLTAMIDLQKRNGTHVPLLVYSDLVVVDENLMKISSSFFRHVRTKPHDTLKPLLLHNSIAGCTMMINRSLREMVPTIPERAIMHDWWIGLMAAGFGRIVCIPQPTLLYRQHTANAAGAKPWSPRQIITDHLSGSWRRVLNATQFQAEIFCPLYGPKLDSSTRQMIYAYANLHNQNWFVRKWIVLKYRLLRTGLVAALGMLFFI